jgi:hypothetical protein
MIILRQKQFGILDSMNSWLIKKYNPKAGKTGQTKEQKTSKSVPATSEEIKSSIIYKLFPTIDPSESDYVDSDKLKSFKTSGLKDKSLVWELYEGSTKVGNGNFASATQGSVITLASNRAINATAKTYKLYIWIDGQQANPSGMMNQAYEFVLSANATDQAPS